MKYILKSILLSSILFFITTTEVVAIEFNNHSFEVDSSTDYVEEGWSFEPSIKRAGFNEGSLGADGRDGLKFAFFSSSCEHCADKIYQEIEIEPNTKYTVTFLASVTGGSSTDQNFTLSNNVGQSDTVNITGDSLTKYTLVLEAQEDATSMKILGSKGNLDGFLNFDDFDITAEKTLTDTVDTDGDGIIDGIDLDDDNDGILDTDDGCRANILPSGVDGTFEALYDKAGEDEFNSNVTGGGWINDNGTADTWKSPMSTDGTGFTSGSGGYGFADGMPASPQGGIFAAAGSWTNGESFYTEFNNLTVGEKYFITFFQAHAGADGETPIGENSRWKVTFGSETLYSPEMAYLGEGNQVWEKVTLVFTPTATEQRLTFQCPEDAADEHPYMAIDDIIVNRYGL